MCNTVASEPSLLIVEDDVQCGGLLACALRKRQFEVQIAGDVARALKSIAAFAPAFAVVDLQPPDGSGLDVIDALHRAEPRSRIVVLTGLGDIATAVAAVRLGAIDYLLKPTRADEIVRSLLDTAPPKMADKYDVTDVEHVHWEYIQNHLGEAGHNVSLTARRLQMHRRTLQRILKFGPPDRYRPALG